MHLINNNLSPYAARVRIQIYAKALPVELKLLPRDELKSPAYLALNPMGKVPCLVDGDDAIPESGTIVSYLEELYPDPSLRGTTPRENAQIRLIEDVAMLGIMGAMSKLFGQMNPKTRNQRVTGDALADLDRALNAAESYVSGSRAAGEKLTLADCALTPALFFVTRLLGAFGRADSLSGLPKLAAYWSHASADPVLSKVTAEMADALKALQGA
jgi:glutathione S-transferase